MAPVTVNLLKMENMYLVVSLPRSDKYCWVSDPLEGAEVRTTKMFIIFKSDRTDCQYHL